MRPTLTLMHPCLKNQPMTCRRKEPDYLPRENGRLPSISLNNLKANRSTIDLETVLKADSYSSAFTRHAPTGS